jgi:hypothetical protein
MSGPFARCPTRCCASKQAIDRAKRGLKTTAKNGGDVNVELALNAALNDLQRIRKRLMQDTYYTGDALRML